MKMSIAVQGTCSKVILNQSRKFVIAAQMAEGMRARKFGPLFKTIVHDCRGAAVCCCS